MIKLQVILFVIKLYARNVFNNRKTRKWCELCLKLTIKTLERRRRSSGVVIINFEHISHLFLVFLLLTLNK